MLHSLVFVSRETLKNPKHKNALSRMTCFRKITVEAIVWRGDEL